MAEQNDERNKLSHAELIQRKLNAKSKNQDAAREEVREKLNALRSGALPQEYKEIVQQKKTYTARQKFIEDPNLEKTYTKPNLIPRPQTATKKKQ